ncbi:signal peptidase I [candidate division WOR-3 bacterium]|nr:signal peptidase I [candidate division WOR-3 bacterium]
MRWLKNLVSEWGPVIVAVLLIRSFVVEAFMVPTGSMLNTILIGDMMLVNKFVYGAKLPFTDKTIIPVSSPKRGDIVIFRFPLDPDVPPGASRIFPAKLPLLPLFWNKSKGFFQWYTPLALVKRCVAVAGDTVLYRDKQLYINGELQDEPYVQHADARTFPGLEGLKDYQKPWENRSFFRTELSAYVRDQFGPVVVPPGCIFVMGDNRDNSEDARFFGPLELRHVRGRPLVTYMSTSAAGYPINIPKMVLSPWAIRLNRIGHLVR